MHTRKNQKDLTETEWSDFIKAVRAIREPNATSPSFAAFASIHSPTHHRRTAHPYPTFLPWHREYIWQFEARLRQENPNVTLPYWNWLDDREIPENLANASDWGVTRAMKDGDLVDDYSDEVSDAMDEDRFRSFHAFINGPHGQIHMNVGGGSGEMASMIRSPEDIIFWLHHCFLDKLWADWQISHVNAEPAMPNPLLPTSIFQRTGNQVLLIEEMEYQYA